MAPRIEVQPWDEFTNISKYGVPSDVQSLLDRLQQNGQKYTGNYLLLAGVVFLAGIWLHFSVFLTFTIFLGLGYGAWFGLMTVQPQLKANSNMILGALLAVFFFFAVKWSEDSSVIWIYLCLSSLPGLIHAALKKRDIVQKASAAVKNASARN